MLSRRALSSGLGGIACSSVLLPVAATAAAPAINLRAIPMATHERIMRLAIAEAGGNPFYPFGAVITRAADGEVMAKGVNNGRANPTLHGEIACMNDYVAHHGNTGWDSLILYTTGEPCPMCMSALVWAGIGGVVFASSIAGIKRAGINQIEITAKQVIEASSFYHGDLLGGVLQTETDVIFMQRKRA